MKILKKEITAEVYFNTSSGFIMYSPAAGCLNKSIGVTADLAGYIDMAITFVDDYF
jgi:hypothetical protein